MHHGRVASACERNTALRLAQYFGARAAWWLDLQSHYDLAMVADQLQSQIARDIKPCALQSMPDLAA